MCVYAYDVMTPMCVCTAHCDLHIIALVYCLYKGRLVDTGMVEPVLILCIYCADMLVRSYEAGDNL